MTDWFQKLTDEDLLELFRYVFNFKSEDIAFQSRSEDSVLFLEKWGSGTEDDPYVWLDTYYYFEDGGFKLDSSDVAVTGKEMRKYNKWMADKFGIEYLCQLIDYHGLMMVKDFTEAFNKHLEKVYGK